MLSDGLRIAFTETNFLLQTTKALNTVVWGFLKILIAEKLFQLVLLII